MLLIRALDGESYSATAVELESRTDAIMRDNPKWSPIRAKQDAAAVMLAEYRREYCRLDSRRIGHNNVLDALASKLADLDEHGTFTSLLRVLSGSSTLLDDSLVAERKIVDAEAAKRQQHASFYAVHASAEARDAYGEVRR